MKILLNFKIAFSLMIFTGLISCTEPYQMQTEIFEEAFVVEATITNELKKQQIKLSKTYRLEENGPTFESGAEIYLEDNLGNRYDFEEQANVYESVSEFQALPGVEYQLFFITAEGRQYSSTKQMLTTSTPIESIGTNIVNKNNQIGVEMVVNSYEPSGTSRYYRYEYEETYKVTVPKWNPYKTILLNQPRICPGTVFPGFETIGFVFRPYESKTCYTSKTSNEIFLTSTNNFTEDRVTNFPVRFIANTDYTIAERYSILVKQYVQTFESYTFYKTLQEMSGSGSLLSPNQPGFINGNIKALDNPREKVIGFFEVSSVNTKRIFFNFHDIFPNSPIPEYFTECDEYTFDSMHFGDPPYSPEAPCGTGGQGGQLRSAIRLNTLVFYAESFPFFTMVKPVCGDCTSFSSNVIPSFWQ